MLASHRRWVTSVFAVAVMAAMIPAGLAQAASPSASGAAHKAVHGPASRSTPAGDVAAASPIVPVWVTLGGRGFVRDAKVEVLDRKGRVLQKARSLSGGLAIFDRQRVTGAATIRVTGGESVFGVKNDAVLRAPISVHPTLIRTSFVSPVSTVAMKVAKKSHVSYKVALTRTTDHLRIPRTADPSDHAITPGLFSHAHFAAFALGNGGVKKALGTLVDEVMSGAPSRSLAAPTKPAGRSLTEWAGEMVITSAYQAATGQVPEGTIGNIFGVENPTTAALGEIQDQLTEIQNELAVISNEMGIMLDAVETGTYDTLVGNLGSLPGDVKSDWVNYQAVVNNDELTDTQTLTDYTNQWISEYGNSMGSFNALFTTNGETGILDQLYTMNQVEYPWWDDSVVTNIQATVDYWGTVQAEASALLSEAWNFQSSKYTSAYILNNVSNDDSTNGFIYASMPTTISKGQVVDPSTQYMYKLAAQNATAATASYAGNDQQNHNASCSSLGSSHVFSGGVIVPASTVEGWWTAAQPTGWTVSDTSPFAVFQKGRSINGVTQSALPVLSSGLPSAWALVTADSVPYLGGWSEPKIVDGHEEGTLYYYTGWLWCGSDTVSLSGLSKSPTQWTENFMMTSSPTGQSVPVNATIPVGVLVRQLGVFDYVPPPN